jgi:tRNA threonylcarbamoyladenosine biosynthesis protein TsaE
MKIFTNSEKETRLLGEALGKKLRPNDCLALWGDFGSGKTTFVKGLACGLRVRHPGDVASPSFVILKIYQGRLPLYHFDLYRLGRARDCDQIGLDEFLASGGVVAIEWPQSARGALPQGTMEVKFKVEGPSRRSLSFKAATGRLRGLVRRIKQGDVA